MEHFDIDTPHRESAVSSTTTETVRQNRMKFVPKNGAAIRRLGERILQMQTVDGALPLGGPGAGGSRRVVPYFGHFGAWGLTLAFRATEEPHFRVAVRRWIEWNDARRNPDGTVYDYKGQPGAWESTKDYDSTDSYGSTYLELLDTFSRSPLPDSERTWLETRLPFAEQSVKAMLLTQQKNGLTTAKPTWPVMYTMDNTEVLRGLMAGMRLGTRLESSLSARHKSGAFVIGSKCAAEIKRVTAAIEKDLWDEPNACYLVGLQTDGGKMKGLSKWYPDIMANLMAIGWLPALPNWKRRHQALYTTLIAKFADSPETGIPSAIHSDGDLERLIWWGFAVKAQGDRPRLERIQVALRAFDTHLTRFTNPATLGHACRILAEEE